MGDLTERLAYVFSVDATGAGEAGFNRLGRSAEGAALSEAKVTVAADKVALAQARVAVAEAKATGDAEKLALAETEVAAAQERLAASKATQGLAAANVEMAGATKSAKGLSAESTIAGRAMTTIGLGAGVAAVAALKFGEDSVRAYTDLAGSIRQYRAVAGGSAEDASRMVAVYEALNIPIEQASSGLFKFGANIDANAQKLQSHGVVIARDAAGNVDLNKTLLNTVAAYQASTSAADRDFIAKTAMGRGAQALIPLLNASNKEIKEFGDAAAARGEVFGDKDLASARQLGIDMRELGADAHAFEVQLGKGIVPLLDDVAKGIDAIVKKSHDLTGGDLGKGIRMGLEASPIGPVILGLEELGKHSKSAGDKTDALAEELRQRAQAEQDATDATEADTTELEKFIGLLGSERSAQEAVTKAREAVTAAQAEGAKKARDEAAATEQMRRADQSLAQAERDLNEAKRQAPENRAKAELDQEQATLDLVGAERAYTVAIEKRGQTSEEAHQADVTRRRAGFALDDATAKAKELEAAGNRPQAVLDAEQRIADAKKTQATAAEAKTKADQEDPIADLAKAETDLRDKTLAELVARQKISTEIRTFNTTFGQTLTLADLLNGKADALLQKLAQAQADEAALSGNALFDFGPAGGVPGFEGGGYTKKTPTPRSSAPATAVEPKTGITIPGPASLTTITIGPVYNNDPDEIARSVAFAYRAR